MSGIFSKDIAVLDINSKTISAIIGVKKSSSVFGIKSIVEKEYQGFVDSDWIDKNDTVQIAKTVLSECLKEASSRTKEIYISVPAEFLSVVTKEVSVSLERRREITEDDVKSLYKKGATFEKETNYCLINKKPIYFVLDDQDVTYDHVEGIVGQNILGCISYVLALTSYYKMFYDIADDLGFRNIYFVGTPLAMCNTLLEKEERDDIYSLIDIGFASSSVSISKGDGLLTMKSFSLGGAYIAGDLYELLNVPFEDALAAQQLVDLNLNYAENDVLYRSEQNILARDVVEIAKCRIDEIVEIVDGIYQEVKDYLPSNMKIFLTGEGIAPMRGAKKYLSDRLGREIEIVTPKLPGFVKSEDSSKIALLLMADKIAEKGLLNRIKKIFVGGKRK